MTKRIGNLWDGFVSTEHLTYSYRNARRGKGKRPDIRKVDSDYEHYIELTRELLVNKEYHTSEYRLFTIHEKGKTRVVADLPFFPDRIIQWALTDSLRDTIMNNLIDQTYAALPGRGAHKAVRTLSRYLKNDDALYYLQIDVHKFLSIYR